MENKIINQSELQTPCFIFDEARFIKNIKNFNSVLRRYFRTSKIGYSFKTNSLPRLLQLVKENGCFAEVVSDDEYHLAEKIGFLRNRIIFNGPVKEKKTFINALEGGSLINIDSKREIEWLLELGYPVKIGIRVNFDLENKLPGQTSTGIQGGRFGFCYENGELHEAIEKLRTAGIDIERLHMHISNATKSTVVYEILTEMACKIIEEEKLNISYIDYGGGYYGGGDNGECYESYIFKIYYKLKKYKKENVGIIVEPGASVVATTFSYLTSVVDKKETTYGNFVITDGTRLHIDPFMVKSMYSYNIMPRRAGKSILQTLCGYTCMEKDRIMMIEATEFEVGDKIEYKVTGSYTICFNSLFITYLPRIYSAVDNQKYVLVREKWDVEEYIQKCRWIL